MLIRSDGWLVCPVWQMVNSRYLYSLDKQIVERHTQREPPSLLVCYLNQEESRDKSLFFCWSTRDAVSASSMSQLKCLLCVYARQVPPPRPTMSGYFYVRSQLTAVFSNLPLSPAVSSKHSQRWSTCPYIKHINNLFLFLSTDNFLLTCHSSHHRLADTLEVILSSLSSGR